LFLEQEVVDSCREKEKELLVKRKILIYQLYQAVEHYLQGDDHALDTFLPSHFVDHVYASGREGIFNALQMMRNSFSDIHIEISHLVVEGDIVFARLIFDLCHTGAFMNVPPTYRRARYTHAVVLRLADDMIVERLWCLTDSFTLWRQLGVCIFLEPDTSMNTENSTLQQAK
jgi:predicted ester cyclase